MPPTAKIFMHGRSQAVRLPKAFRLPGKEVRVSREGNRIILEPIEADHTTWRKELDALIAEHGPFLPDGIPEPSDADDIDFDPPSQTVDGHE